MVTGIEAKIEGTTVKLTWNKVSGADKYAISSKIKAGDKWSKIVTVKDTSSFVDVNPCVDCTNYYSVRGYSSSTKTYGVMNKTGVSIYVKDSDEVRPTITPLLTQMMKLTMLHQNRKHRKYQACKYRKNESWFTAVQV